MSLDRAMRKALGVKARVRPANRQPVRLRCECGKRKIAKRPYCKRCSSAIPRRLR